MSIMRERERARIVPTWAVLRDFPYFFDYFVRRQGSLQAVYYFLGSSVNNWTEHINMLLSLVYKYL